MPSLVNGWNTDRRRMSLYRPTRSVAVERAAAIADRARAPILKSATKTVPIRTLMYGFGILSTMARIKAEEVRIPRWAREAVSRHEDVVVVNRERAAYVIVHPDDHRAAAHPPRRGRPLRDALALLAQAAPPDRAFAEDMQAVLETVGVTPPDPWAQS
jgi:hypothetical protein